jgi:carbon monoxide dehydrogenase subunit G
LPVSPKAVRKVRLEDAFRMAARLLSYDVEASVGGKLAQLGVAGLIDSVAKKFADQFFSNFAKELSPESAES